MANRPRHKNKDIEAAIKYAESHGWVYVRSASHGWGVFHCPHHGRAGFRHTINSTPTSPRTHADQFIRLVNRCLAEH